MGGGGGELRRDDGSESRGRLAADRLRAAYNRQAIKIDRVNIAPGGAVWTILTKERRGGGNCEIFARRD